MNTRRCFDDLRRSLCRTAASQVRALSTATSTPKCTRLPPSYLPRHDALLNPVSIRPHHFATRRHFTNTPISRSKFSKDLPADGDITSPQIMISNPAKGMKGPYDTRSVLDTLNLEKYTLRVIAAPGGELPICRIFGREEATEQDRAQARREKRKAQKAVKEVEFNWAIARHDMEVKLKRTRAFLEAGHRVEILLQSKRHSRRADKTEALAVLEAVKAAMREIPGVREAVKPDGEILSTMRLVFEKEAQ